MCSMIDHWRRLSVGGALLVAGSVLVIVSGLPQPAEDRVAPRGGAVTVRQAAAQDLSPPLIELALSDADPVMPGAETTYFTSTPEDPKPLLTSAAVEQTEQGSKPAP